MLPKALRYWLFDTLSVQTMRYVSAVPTRKAEGLTKLVYDMIREDFFKNGSLTSRSAVPEMMAAIWIGGRESMLVADRVDRTTKDAISAVLSQENDCPYCEDMLVSLVHAGGEHDAAQDIFEQNGGSSTDEILRRQLDWVRALVTVGADELPETPFTDEQLPEILGTLMGMSDINRFSHVVMADSPVSAPFGVNAIKSIALRLFGNQLVATREVPLTPGRSLRLLPPAELPADLEWSKSNPRVADAIARWTATVEREAAQAVTQRVKSVVAASLMAWQGERMPLSRSWVEAEVKELSGAEQDIARLAIVLAKAPYQVDEAMAETVLRHAESEEQFVRILGWASFTGARRFTNIVASHIKSEQQADNKATQIAFEPRPGLVA